MKMILFALTLLVVLSESSFANYICKSNPDHPICKSNWLGEDPVYKLIKNTGHNQGVLQIKGYVTERANPIVEYYKSIFYTEDRQELKLSSEHEELISVVNHLDEVGFSPREISGGTHYIIYTVNIKCSDAGDCILEKPSWPTRVAISNVPPRCPSGTSEYCPTGQYVWCYCR